MAHSAEEGLRAQGVLSLTTRKLSFYIGVMKWRNQLLALLCLLAFAGLGVLYFQHWVVQKPFGIILFVAEGLGPGQLAPARLYAGGADQPLALDGMSHLALLNNYSNDFASPDQAAAATAIATGVRTNTGSLGIDSHGNRATNLLDLARNKGRATGLIASAQLTDPTAAAFYAHTATPEDKTDLARHLIETAKIDIVLGGGSAEFLPRTKGGKRSDERDLLLEARRSGFDLVRSRAELEAIPGWRRPKLFGVFSPAELAFADELEGRSEQPSLSDMVRRAIELLQFNRGGYLLVVDVGLIRKAAQENNAERTLAETLELDRGVSVALRYAGAKAQILVCGDVAIGGLSLNGAPYRKDNGVAVLGLNSSGDPWLTWATGPNGIASYGATRRKETADPDAADGAMRPTLPQEPVAVYAENALNTVSDVMAFGEGPGAEVLHGSLDSTAVFRLIRANL